MKCLCKLTAGSIAKPDRRPFQVVRVIFGIETYSMQPKSRHPHQCEAKCVEDLWHMDLHEPQTMTDPATGHPAILHIETILRNILFMMGWFGRSEQKRHVAHCKMPC
jgi:hypothetical protein